MDTAVQGKTTTKPAREVLTREESSREDDGQAIPPASPKFPNAGDSLNPAPPTPQNEPNSPHDSPEFPTGENDLNDLNERQRAAIELLVLGQATGMAAKRLGIDRKTLFNWRQQPAFQRELRRRRDELCSEAGERIRGMLHPALDVLDEQLHDPYDRARFRAANTILKLANVTKACSEGDDER
jgi:hypothetical protein